MCVYIEQALLSQMYKFNPICEALVHSDGSRIFLLGVLRGGLNHSKGF